MQQFIKIKNAKVNNLKNITLDIPRNKFVVITGLSGSGKSSLAFDTLYAEGQRMYLESLNVYIRQFIGKIQKPNVEYIKGLSPAIAIRQKTGTRNPRSTVGTLTEIYDYLRILYVRIGQLYSPISGKKVIKHSTSDIVDFILSFEQNTMFAICFKLNAKNNKLKNNIINTEFIKGYTRIIVDYKIINIEDVLDNDNFDFDSQEVFVMVDRIITDNNEENIARILDSSQVALDEGDGKCYLINYTKKEKFYFSDILELDGIVFEKPNSSFFNFNSPHGFCKLCNGTGSIFDIDKKKVIPNPNLSLVEGAIAPWNSLIMSKWLEPLLKKEYTFPLKKKYNELTENKKKILWEGYKKFRGLNAFFKFLEDNYKKIQYRVLLNKYKGTTECSDCLGTGIKKEAKNIKIHGKNIIDLLLFSIHDLAEFFNNIILSEDEMKVSKIIIHEIKNRLYYLKNIGLSHLTLSRKSATLSGGEYQRANLANSLNSSLIGTIYILDEPTVGLHPRDTEKLIKALIDLKDLENTVIVVEHEEEVMHKADHIIDIGPDGGSRGGKVMFQGTVSELKKFGKSHTAKYLNYTEKIKIPSKRRKSDHYILIPNISENNLKNINVKIPLNIFNVITGVSGSGKTTLIKNVIYPLINKSLDIDIIDEEKNKYILGDFDQINFIEFMNQNSIIKNSRSIPLTITKTYEDIRLIFARQLLAIENEIPASMFSFNNEGGRCEECKGEGIKNIEMQFMADIILKCEKCKGLRFKENILEIKYKEKNIYDVLEMTVDDSIDFFCDHPLILQKIKPLQKVGLGYIKLGQSTSSLSGGEAQRLKLANYLKDDDKKSNGFFIFDEPTVGLHPYDINKLINAFTKLIDQGNTVLVVEHNLDIIKCADWILDLGPESGAKGGYLTFEGTPERMIKKKKNITAKYLKKKFNEPTF